MSKEGVLPTYESVTKSTASRSSIWRTVMVSLVTCLFIFSFFNSESVLSTISKGAVVCKSQTHGQKTSVPTSTSLEESSHISILPAPDAESRSAVGKHESFSLRRRSGDASEAASALSADGRSGYNRREEEDGRSGYNNVEDGRSGYNRREEEDGRSGYNRREEEDGRSGYNNVEDGRSGYNRREEEDGRSGYNRAA
ncbi:hypothetical protein LX36DRAFT_671196 [Colletotrichum falcatum]|nr:hypothetical protein LX36DRAFT_671196 [Colletotrichum falcatum]